jgi:hypothetical protein
VHKVLAAKRRNHSPSYRELCFPKYNNEDGLSEHGWRLEHFIADEVMKCNHGRLFTESFDAEMRALLYGRAGPISSAIAITIDLAADG